MQMLSLNPEQQMTESGGGRWCGDTTRIGVSQALDTPLRSRTTGTIHLMTILQMRTWMEEAVIKALQIGKGETRTLHHKVGREEF